MNNRRTAPGGQMTHMLSAILAKVTNIEKLLAPAIHNLPDSEILDSKGVRLLTKMKHGTYNKYGFAITLHQYCICPRCNHILNAGPDYQPDYCSKCGQHVNCSDVPWEEEVQLGYVRKEERCE